MFSVLLLLSAISSTCCTLVNVNICLTPECKETVNSLTDALNKSAFYCDDFYEHSCGGWISKTARPSHQPIWNYWQSVSDKINLKLSALLGMQLEDAAFQKARTMFRSCLNMDRNEEMNLRQLKDLVSNLGGWPLIEKSWDRGSFDWAGQMVEVMKAVGLYPILRIVPEADYENTSAKILYVQIGDVNLPVSVLTNPTRHTEKVQLYERWIYQSVKALYISGKKMYEYDRLQKDIRDLVTFEIKLAKLSYFHDSNQKVSLQTLSQVTGLNWSDVLQQLFSEGGTNSVTIKNSDYVAVNSLFALKEIVLLLNTTKKEVIANYLIWSVVKDFSRDTTRHLRKLNFLMDRSFFGVKSETSVEHECLSHIKTHFGFALAAHYAKAFARPNAIPLVEDMVRKIKSEFVRVLEENQWLAAQTRLAATEKIAALEYCVGYPKWVENETLVGSYYQSLEIVENNHFWNILKIKEFRMKRDLSRYSNAITVEHWFTPFEVNAFYSVLQNTIVIPIGIMEAPFFDVNRPDVFNYGSLGSLIGHEVSHALDTTGRKFNKDGQLTTWWQEEDIAEYEKRSECFEQQYNKYGIDGYTTLGENIADNTGLVISYRAFRNTRASDYTVIIPDLGMYTNEQLFFISFAQLWCEISNENPLLNEGDHSPVRQRVLGTISNSVEFDVAFHCSSYDKTRCNLW